MSLEANILLVFFWGFWFLSAFLFPLLDYLHAKKKDAKA